MKQRAFVVRALVALLAGAASVAVSACAVNTESGSAESGEAHGQTSEALARVGAGPIATVVRPPPPPPPPPELAFPPPNAIYCPTVEPRCSVANDGTRTPQLVALGCSDELHWFTGNSSGLLGGIVTLCPDTDAVRTQLSSLGSPVVNTCSACLPQAPPGEIYILLEAFVGPNCESGCLTHPIGQVGQVGQVDTGSGLN